MTELSLVRNADWAALLSQLPKDYEALADEHRQLETQYGNAKITSADWLLRFILLHTGANLPLRQTVALIAESGGPTLSAMRLHMKMRRATPYLQALVERMVGWTSKAKPELWAGYSLVLVDASTVCGPGAVGADARLHTKLRVADAAIVDAVVTDASGGETFRNFQFQPGELVIGDRLYANPNNVALALEQGADVLIRHNRNALPLTSDGRKLDIMATLREIEGDEPIDLDVKFVHDGQRMSGRFIAIRLPKVKAERARAKLKKKDLPSSKVSADSLEAAGYVTLFTTAPRDRMSAERCLDAYRLRWQIELQFKRWKSLCGFDRLPNYRDDTIVAWLYAKLLLGIMLDRVSSIRDEISPPVHLAEIPRPPRRKRRRRTTLIGAPTVETDKHLVSASRRRASSAVSS
jgi:hypothetical protein